MIDRESLAWAAGFYEGEGCISSSNGPGIQISVVQREPEMLHRFQQVFGFGKIMNHGRTTLSPRDTFVWYVGSFEKCQAVIAMIWPWLSTRRKEQAKRCLLRYEELRVKRPRRIRNPNPVGWEYIQEASN
jgi:hypothetical protein